LPAARYWRAAAVDMAEDLLGVLKAGVFDPASPLEVGRITWEISGIEGMLSRLKRLDGAGLVAEYRDWLGVYPAIVAGMVAAARRLERARRAALLAYLGFGEPKGKAA
ncbi:MAG: hypothetical protein LAQ30_29865, partial [Acidobacteriia bacterium]|nr:hypothetical protein [Terriglobia bacterium]